MNITSPAFILNEESPITTGGSKGRILLVDDEPVLRAMVGTVLLSQGWEVLNASSGEEAEQLLKYCVGRHTPVDVVILDLILPGGISGMEAVQVLRQIQPGIRIVASSSFFASDDSKSSCLNLGFDDILPKPYSATDLTAVMERNARRSSSRRAA
jgi:DNA-binding response OmpR family regulator